MKERKQEGKRGREMRTGEEKGEKRDRQRTQNLKYVRVAGERKYPELLSRNDSVFALDLKYFCWAQKGMIIPGPQALCVYVRAYMYMCLLYFFFPDKVFNPG